MAKTISSPCCNVKSQLKFSSVTSKIGTQEVWQCVACDALFVVRS